MLFYYTATGNCLYVARALDENLISIPQALKKQILMFEDEVIGIVTPVYAGEAPKTVKKFIQKATLKANYVYIISTYGKGESIASQWVVEYAKENGLEVHYANTLLMVDNYLPSFDMNEEKALDKKVNEQIANIKKDIELKKCYIKEPTQAGIDLYNGAHLRFSENPHFINGESLYVNEMCKGCGICTQVCPVGNMEVIDGKATRKDKTCDFCLACIHHCPFKGLSLKYGDKNPEARYTHEKITLQDIIKANKQ